MSKHLKLAAIASLLTSALAGAADAQMFGGSTGGVLTSTVILSAAASASHPTLPEFGGCVVAEGHDEVEDNAVYRLNRIFEAMRFGNNTVICRVPMTTRKWNRYLEDVKEEQEERKEDEQGESGWTW